MEKETTTLNLRKDIKTRANDALKKGCFPGIDALGALVDKALDDLLNKTPGA